MDAKGTIELEIQNTIAVITFYHPASNSFPSYLLEALEKTIYHVSTLSEINVLVLKSKGNNVFCAGASFDELLSITNLEEGLQFFSGFAKVINAMRKCAKIIVGNLQGKAVGGGVGLAAACDYVFATQNAAIKLSELAIGIGPFVIEPSITKKIGKSAFASLTLDANNWKSAQWAFEKGLYHQVFATFEEMENASAVFANQLANYNPQALLAMKKVLWENTEHWDVLLLEKAAISGSLVLSDFTKKALLDFKKKD